MNPTPAVALRRIAAAKENKATTLDLSGLHLTAIPPELEDLAHLQELNLSYNNISEIKGLENLSNLQRLDLHSNKISEIKDLGMLSSLQILYLSDNKISEIKNLGMLSSLQALYLFSNQISEIKGLENLSNLQQLHLSKNPISKIKGLDMLSSLQILYLSRNPISEIKGLDKLSNLQKLDLFGNQISEIKGLDQLSSLKILYLSVNKISEIKGLDKLSNLQELNLSDNPIREIKSLDMLDNLQELNLSGNQISEIKGLDKLSNLQKLHLFGNKISEIKGLDKLSNLQELYLSKNLINEIKGLDKLSNLQRLGLSENPISEIKGLDNLSKLQELYLSKNLISEIKGLDMLSNLQALYLSKNPISEIKGLDKLSNLQELNLSDNKISEIKGLENLSNLQRLVLHSNKISEIKGLENLSNLQALYLFGNQISEIKGLDNLSNLKILDIYENKISEIKGLENLSKLQKLALFGNQISEIKGLDTLFHTLAQLEYLAIWDNPLSAADLYLKMGDNNLSQIKEHLKIRSAEEQLIPFRLPVKVLLLGNHGAGKSSLLHYLTTKKLPEDCKSTPILQIKAYPSAEKPEILYYDFGGQDYYHGLYKIFIRNPAAVQVLLFRQCHNRNHIAPDSEGLETVHFNVRYWLGQQKYVAEHQKKPLPSPPLLIRSHSDCEEESPFSALQGFNISEQHALILRRSSSTSLNELRLQVVAALLNESVEKHRIVKDYADWYGDFYRYIMRQNQTANHEAVSVQAVVLPHFKGAKADREAEDSEQKRLESLKIHLQELYDATGLVLYYKDIAPDKIWLNPMAFVQHIHQNVFDKEHIKDKKGRVAATVLEKKVTQPELELLQKQKVIFRHEYSDTGEPEYILPNYLPLANSDPQYELLRFGLEQQTAFKMRFTDFLPLGFINQLVDLFGKQPDKKIFWRDALIFTFERFAKVLIELNFEQLEIRVQVYFLPHHHPAAHHKDVLHYLFYTLLALYRDVEVLTYEAYRSKNTQLRADSDFEQHRWQEYEDLFSKAAPQDLYVALSDDNYVRFRDLCNKDENARRISACCFDEQNTIKSDTVQEVAIYPYQFFTNKTFKRMTRIFISYSKMDLPLILEFQDHLSALKRDNLVESWFCTELLAGGKWDNDIQEHFNKADMVCFMVSPNFMRTDYIYDYEIKKAFERQNEDPNFKIVPIILDFCRWKTQAYNLSDFTALPYTAKPICDFENRNLAWYIVIECLRMSIEEGKYPNSEDYFAKREQFPQDIKAYFKRIVAANKDGGKVP